ncbi:hypothetical protein ERO13_D08G233850v2 [Gossypium hirsutum]|uniref:Transmembrane protein n=2 Tax=Gossypium TaxID=3633 RepID=A0A0D2PI32_GOSRA|nr:hypothetical protein ERO13_D08G233850v2 [Gossypium hirsutum]KJB26578.1 hypothetical protein B456_004G248500 [Gossypium raimondii]TYH60079.1 hypothetical protein ES332_D08G268000v1 [Gossypium tomentosum]
MASFKVTVIFAILLMLSFHHVLAIRTLEEEQAKIFIFNKNLTIQLLPRGPVPPSAGNPCTNIPGRSHGRCTLTEMNVAGGGSHNRVVHHAPPTFSDSVSKFHEISIA